MALTPKKVYGALKRYIDNKIIEAGAVSGVKGDAENEYRQGDVNITPENLGIDMSTKQDTITISGKTVQI